jgi:lipid II:glycine glycyltransferase (peptidoglycan interpeptide bridge formation enzyme)
MDTIVLEPETLRYWSFIKEKDALISLLGKSMSEMLTFEKELEPTQNTGKQHFDAIATIRQHKEKELWAKMPAIKKENIKVSQWALDIVKDVPPIAEDVDYDKIKLDYIMQKYG